MERHDLNPYPLPKDNSPLYINEPWLIDKSLLEYPPHPEPEEDEDNVRIYVPVDLNRKAILRRLDCIISQYGEANEDNESDYYTDVSMLISQIEIYDQICYVRNMPEEGKHSAEAISLVREFVEKLEEIPDGCAECFPFDIIDKLKEDFLSDIS